MPAAEQHTDPLAEHGEGPIWSAEWGGLAWVDMLAGDILRLDDTGTPQRWHVGPVAAAFRPRRSGGLVIATEHEFVLADAFGGDTRRVAAVVSTIRESGSTTAVATRPARSGAGPWPTTRHPAAASCSGCARTGAVERVLADVTISNGLAWTPDGTQAYYIDTPTGRIDVFDVDQAGELANRRPFARIDPADGHPDGLTLDADGRVWVALWGGAAVRCYDPAGQLVEEVTLPAPR